MAASLFPPKPCLCTKRSAVWPTPKIEKFHPPHLSPTSHGCGCRPSARYWPGLLRVRQCRA
eukprot:475202-Alexandrium_andersonii.AAC.1